MPFNLIGSLIGAGFSAINTAQTNKTNKEIAESTNKANREMVEMQNKAAKQEAELAYNRSKASNQVAQMTAAGMSRAGAINALSGGGSYTPAPVNTSQDSAPTMQADPNAANLLAQGIASIDSDKAAYNMRDRKQLQGIYDVITSNKNTFVGDAPTIKQIYQLVNDKQKKALTNPYVRSQVNDFINQTFTQGDSQHKAVLSVYQTHNEEYNREIRQLDIQLRRIVQQDKITAAQREEIARAAEARLRELQASTSTSAFENMDKETLLRYAETRATLEWLSHIGDMSAEKVIDKLRTLVGL